LQILLNLHIQLTEVDHYTCRMRRAVGRGSSDGRSCKKFRVEESRGSDTENHIVECNEKNCKRETVSWREAQGENSQHSSVEASTNAGGDRDTEEWRIYEEFFAHHQEEEDKGGNGDDEDKEEEEDKGGNGDDEDKEEEEDEDDNEDKEVKEDEEAYARDNGEYGVFDDRTPVTESDEERYESSATQDSSSVS
jgi:hypothetical protein